MAIKPILQAVCAFQAMTLLSVSYSNLYKHKTGAASLNVSVVLFRRLPMRADGRWRSATIMNGSTMQQPN
jgi:hypothetical protein